MAGGLLESKACALSHHATLSHNHESQFWKQLFIVCCLFAAATPGYPAYHALCLQVSCSTWKPAETDAVDICHLLRVPAWPSFLGCKRCTRSLWQSHDRVVSSVRQPFVLKPISVLQMLCHLSKTSAALVIRLSFLFKGSWWHTPTTAITC